MNIRTFLSIAATVSLLSPLLVGATTKEAPKGPAADAPKGAVPANPKPVLRFDNSPVSDSKSGLVTSYADVIEPVQKAVVSIYSTKTVTVVNPILRQFFGAVPGTESQSKQEGLGSGVVVSPDGYILTNNHVVEGADELTVAFSDDRKFTARLIGADPKTDIAIVKIDAHDLPTVVLADSDKLRVGDIVFAVGNPLAVGETVTMGIVSAKGRGALGLLDDVGGYEDFIQTDAAINLGNSGGALVDAKGRLVGINSAILSPSRGNVGIGFAVPSNLAASVMQSLIATGTVVRGYLGVSGDALKADVADALGLPKDSAGVIVTDVDPGSPAEKAGIKSSDVIVAIGDKPVSSSEELRLRIAEMAPGSTAALKLVREGRPETVSVKLGKLADRPNELIAGVDVEVLSDANRRRLNVDPRIQGGLLVTSVADSSPYADDLAPDMIIVSINRRSVADLASASAMMEKPGRYLLLVYYRGGLSYLALNVAKRP